MPNPDELRARVRRLSAESIAAGDPVGWFERLYAEAGGDAEQVPWADRRPNRNLVSWLERERPAGRGVRACVVGCGLGEDAELLSRWQFDVTAFDVSPTAIDWCRRRYPSTRVRYEVADLFATPEPWRRAFGFVFEAYTVQPLPLSVRVQALDAVSELVASDGRLLLVARAREDWEPTDGPPPWALTRADVEHVASRGLTVASFEDDEDDEDPPVRRFRVLYERRDP